MQISSVVDIVGGKLLNSPAISFITQIHTNPSKVNEGDLFVATLHSDIEEAISNGAFGVIFNFNYQYTDEEIAWIQVDNIKETLIKLLRFTLSTKEIKSFYCDNISFDLLKVFSPKNKDTIFLEHNIIKDFELIKSCKDVQTIFSLDEKYIKSFQPLSCEFVVNQYDVQNLTKHSLFYTTFSYQEQFFSKLKLPSLYINEFLSVLEFYNNEIDFSKLKNFQHFTPIFVNKNIEIIDFGKSNKFIIANKEIEEIEFLKNEYDYAKIKIIEKFEDDTSLFNQISKLDFNALCIIGKTTLEIETLLNKFKKSTTTLI